MTDLELARLVLGVFAAVLVGGAIGFATSENALFRAGVALVISVYTLVGHLTEWEAIIVIFGAVILAGWHTPEHRINLAFAAAIWSGASAFLVAEGPTRSHVHAAVHSPRIAVLVLGFLVATLAAGEVIGALTRPLIRGLRPPGGEDREDLASAGRIIGWIERALIYGAVLLGHPEAAALVVAAKSLARFGEFRDAPFVEYFLIGTLLSIVSALAVGEAVAGLV
jgi:hypothetical protein